MFPALVLATALAPSVFSYAPTQRRCAAPALARTRDGIASRSVAFAGESGCITGTVVDGKGSGPHPAILFVHWLGDEATTNQTEFARDALALAKKGVTSLLIDAMWSQKDWFDKGRTPAVDYERSIAQVKDLRRSLDLLLRERNVDTNRIAYVGHDFGSMYGAVLSGVDERVQSYVLMAGTTTFSEWYLLGDKPNDVSAYEAQMAPLDPPQYLARSKARAFYFQFSAHDRYITPEKELAFFQAAPLPKSMSVYDVDHSLNTPAAFADRLAWLSEKLGL